MSASNTYQSLLDRIDYVPIFFEPWYLDQCCGTDGWSYEFLNQDGRVAVWPYLINRKLLWRRILPAPFVKWSGPLFSSGFSDEEKKEGFSQLFSKLPEVAFFQQNLFYEIEPTVAPHIEITEKYSYRLDLTQSLENVFGNIHTNYRKRNIPAAAHLDLRFDEDAGKMADLQFRSYVRGGYTAPFSRQFLIAHIEKIIEKNRGCILSLHDQAQIYAAVFLIWDKNSSYYHLAGMDPELRKSGASIRLIWEVIKYTFDQLELPIFDFEGSMIPSIERVRKSFGAQKKIYFQISQQNSFIYKYLTNRS